MSEPASPPIPDEWLSAYLDGELAADEAARVETAVSAGGSEAARLETFRRLRGLLRSLPTPVAPDGLFPPEDVSPAYRRRRGGRTLRKAALAATALGLAGVAAVMMAPERPALVADARPAPKEKAAPADLRQGVKVGSVTAAEPAPASAPMINPPLLGGPTVKRLPPTADVPRPGQLVSIIERGLEGETVVVDLVVADVARSAGDLRVLLQTLGVPESAVTEERERAGDELVAVYVQAEASVTDAVMRELRRRRAADRGRQAFEKNAIIASNIAAAPAGAGAESARAAPGGRAAEGYGTVDGFAAEADAALSHFEAAEPPAPAVEAEQFEMLADPAASPYQQTLNVAPTQYNAILSNNLIDLSAGDEPPPAANRLLIVLRRDEGSGELPM